MVTDDAPVLTVSQAAQLAGMHPQTLRQYDRLGLVVPRRTRGRGRRYSRRDVARLLEVQRLAQSEGVNLAGIKRILELEQHVSVLEQRLGSWPACWRSVSTPRAGCSPPGRAVTSWRCRWAAVCGAPSCGWTWSPGRTAVRWCCGGPPRAADL